MELHAIDVCGGLKTTFGGWGGLLPFLHLVEAVCYVVSATVYSSIAGP